MIELLASALILSGSAVVLLAAIGLTRFEGVFPKMHAATKSATLGVLLAMGGAALRIERAHIPALLLVGVLQLLTAPISAHLVGRATYRTVPAERARLQIDELAVRADLDGEPADDDR